MPSGKGQIGRLHLAVKAFAPGRQPFLVCTIATGWDFRQSWTSGPAPCGTGLRVLVHTNQDGVGPRHRTIHSWNP
jgi:sulfate adenylyltransferase subunit 2